MAKPIVFVSYSHKDHRWMQRLVGHLKVASGTFDVWTDDDIGAGDAWYQRIEQAMRQAAVSVLLVSANSLTSTFILRAEVTSLLQRRDREGMPIVPVIVKDCAWDKVDWLAAMQVRPRFGRPLQSRKAAAVETELKNIASEVAELIARAPALPPAPRIIDWEEKRDTSQFVGRTQEIDDVKKLLAGTRSLAIVARGGMGKSLLLSKAAMEMQDQFDCVLWRTLKDAKTLQELVVSCLRVLTSNRPGVMPTVSRARMQLLLAELEQRRCLLMFDNVESIMDGGGRAGKYRHDYEDYEEFFGAISTTPHRSCIVITTRELPEQFREMEGTGPVQVYSLRGLDTSAARQLLAQRQVQASDDEAARLVERYGGNPNDIRLVADPILRVYGGSVETFLSEGEAIAGLTERTLAWHFDRTSAIETSILYWLALAYEPVPPAVLARYVESATQVAKGEFQEAMQSLDRRSLLERFGGGFTLQGVVMEYAQRRFVEAIAGDIRSGDTSVLRSHPLLLAGARDSIKRSQQRQIIGSVLDELRDLEEDDLNGRIRQLLDVARARPHPRRGYTGGNVVNLLLARHVELTGLDLSGLAVWQAYLQGAELRGVKLDESDLSGSVFTETFSDITSVACNSAGTLAATGSTSGEVRLWRLPEATLLHQFDGHRNEVWTLTFSPDGTTLVSGGEDETVRFWNVESLTPGETLTETGGAVFALAFHPSGSRLAYAGNNGTFVIRDLDLESTVHAASLDVGVYALAWSPNGELIASGDNHGLVRLWRVSAVTHVPDEVHAMAGHTDWIRSVAFSPDNRLVASGSYDRTVQLWDAGSGAPIRQLQGHTGWVRSVAFSAAGQLASGSNDGTVRLWDVTSGRCERVLEGHVGTVWSVAWTPDSKTVVSGGNDQTIRFWDTAKGEEAVVLKGFVNSIRGLAFHPGGKLLASGGSDHCVRVWDLDAGEHRTLKGHSDWVRSVAFNPTGDRLLSTGNDRTITIWNTASAKRERVLSGHKNWIYHVAPTVDGRLVTCSTDRTLRLWTMMSAEETMLPTGPDDVAGYAAAISADARLVAAGGTDYAIRVWDLPAMTCRPVLLAHRRLVSHLRFDASGSTLISCGDKRVVLWDVASGTLLKELTGHTDWVRCAVFSPDASLAVSGGDDKEVRLWDCRTGESLWVGREHTSIVFAVAFHPDAGMVASASNDETIRLWDVASGKCVRTLRNARPYEGASIRGVSGLTDAQKMTLATLGAVE